MANLQTMYPGVANSPDTFLVEGLTVDGTVMYVADGAVFGEIPTLAVIGQAELAETVQITGKQSDGGYTIIRGVEGKRQAWAKTTNVARNWTNKDYEAVRINIEAVNDWKVDKVAGKGLSTHDYDDEAKDKVDAIPPNPKYTDTVPDMSKYATLSLYEEISNDFTQEINRLEYNIGDARNSISYDVQKVSVELTEDVNNAKAAHDADIKRLESQKLNKTDVVNDLTTGGVDKALSAEQGKTLFTYADNGKKSIADAIVGKGVSATKSDSFGVLADKISKIKTGYGVGEEVPDKNIEEVKTFYTYENESDCGFRQKKLEYVKDDKTIECGEPSALAINDCGNLCVTTSAGELWGFDINLSYRHVAFGYKPYTAIALLPDGDIWTAYEGLSSIYLSGITGTRSEDKMLTRSWMLNLNSKLIKAMASVPNEFYIYCGADNKVVKVTTGVRTVWEFTSHTAQVNAVTVGKDGCIYSGGADNKVFKISSDGKKIWEFTLHTGAVNAVAVDDDGYVYSGGADCTIYKISPDGKKVWEDKTNNEITALAVAPDRSILCGTTGSTFYVFQPDIAPPTTAELTYKDEKGTVVPDGDVVDIVVANDASVFYVTKKAKVITKMKLGYYTTSYKIIK